MGFSLWASPIPRPGAPAHPAKLAHLSPVVAYLRIGFGAWHTAQLTHFPTAAVRRRLHPYNDGVQTTINV